MLGATKTLFALEEKFLGRTKKGERPDKSVAPADYEIGWLRLRLWRLRHQESTQMD